MDSVRRRTQRQVVSCTICTICKMLTETQRNTMYLKQNKNGSEIYLEMWLETIWLHTVGVSRVKWHKYYCCCGCLLICSLISYLSSTKSSIKLWLVNLYTTNFEKQIGWLSKMHILWALTLWCLHHFNARKAPTLNVIVLVSVSVVRSVKRSLQPNH